MNEYRESDEKDFMGYDDDEVDGDNIVDDVDMTAPQPVQDTPDQPEPQPGADEDGFGGDAPEPAEDSPVVGRRNEDLPTENLSVPDATN